MDSKPAIIQLTGGHAVAIRTRIRASEIASFFEGAFVELEAVAGRQISGPPFAIHHATEGDELDVAAAMPTWSRIEGTGRVEPVELVAGPAVKVEHVGRYEDLAETYALIDRWLAENQRSPGGPRREVYLTMPMAMPWEQITIVIQPLQPVPPGKSKPAPDAHIERTTRQELGGAPISK